MAGCLAGCTHIQPESFGCDNKFLISLLLFLNYFNRGKQNNTIAMLMYCL